MLKMLYKVELGSDTGAYLVTDGQNFLFYNLDAVYIATVPPEWRLVEKLGTVETADDFERLTGKRPELFIEDCRLCGQPALLLIEHDDGICVDCQPEGSDEKTDYVN
ncbi:MAG TPA: hypothetical protein VJT09_04305 [Pyrinomonadaceae bacterium]|nr:hypothetical protein [Pyrinomonadaceae bacterium]